MYVECCKGGLNEEWFIVEKDHLSFRDFQLKLMQQMLMYDPRQQMYPGNENFRTVTNLGGKQKMGGRAQYWKGEKGRMSIKKFQNCQVLNPLFAFTSMRPIG
jgi:hypothetical protein